MLRNSPGSLTRLTASQKTSSPISTQPSTLIGPERPTRRAAASRDCALSVAVAMVRDSNASGGGGRPPPARVLSLGQPLAAGGPGRLVPLGGGRGPGRRAVRGGNRVDHDLGSLAGVDRVRPDLLAVELLPLELLGELRALADEL